MKRKIIISVSNDISSDQRVNRTSECFIQNGYEVILVGILRKKSQDILARNYNVKRLNFCFQKNVFFYAELQIRFFFFLLFSKCDALYANDLDCLLPNFLVHKIKRIPLIYDSHEYFTEVPELQKNSFAKKTWLYLEKQLFPHLQNVITVCDSIANIYSQKYKIPIIVIRNLPTRKEKSNSDLKEKLGIPKEKKIILYQGAINIDRGLEEAIESMIYLNDFFLLIVGDGDILEELKQKTKQLNLYDRILFTGRIALENLIDYTSIADLGISLEKDSNLNYKFCLPNKLFDYIQAEVPVLASPLEEIKKIIEIHQVGECISSHKPKEIAMHIQNMLNDDIKYSYYIENEKKAKKILCWEEEKKKLENIIIHLN